MMLLEGIRVIDLTTVIAAPFAAVLMADFGADVIKVEVPGKGDPFRTLGPYHGKEAMRWASMARNKRAITLDVRKPAGKAAFLKLVEKCDVLLENFRTGTLDKWGLDIETLRKANPKIVVTRVTGYGQTGPYAEVAGFGTPATAFSGMTYLTGYKDRPPVSPSFSLVDYVSGLYAAMGTMMALYHRDVLKGKPQEVDISLYESIFRMLEIPIADYHKNNHVRERTPSLSGSSSPGGTFETRDGKWVVLICSTDRTWEYLTVAMNREELKTDPRFCSMRDRLANDEVLNKIVADWIGGLDYVDLKAIADKEGVPVSLVYSMADIFNDPHYAAREDILEMPHKTLGSIKMPGIFPKFSETPGSVRWVGPDMGAHNEEIYCDMLGYTKEEFAAMKEDGVI